MSKIPEWKKIGNNKYSIKLGMIDVCMEASRYGWYVSAGSEKTYISMSASLASDKASALAWAHELLSAAVVDCALAQAQLAT